VAVARDEEFVRAAACAIELHLSTLMPWRLQVLVRARGGRGGDALINAVHRETEATAVAA